jgi:hypothetical protein
MANRPQCNSNALYSALYGCIVALAGYAIWIATGLISERALILIFFLKILKFFRIYHPKTSSSYQSISIFYLTKGLP